MAIIDTLIQWFLQPPKPSDIVKLNVPGLTVEGSHVDGFILAAGDVTGVAPDEGVFVSSEKVAASDESSVHIVVPAQ